MNTLFSFLLILGSLSIYNAQVSPTIDKPSSYRRPSNPGKFDVNDGTQCDDCKISVGTDCLKTDGSGQRGNQACDLEYRPQTPSGITCGTSHGRYNCKGRLPSSIGGCSGCDVS
ncbi:hypothetical protein Pst134EA_002804 [Puccinia striiformis f. sp. tritici]|uniref:hypothetical protein n=1 Tax=Puccinia striiformis f. sp. tritici TaxID=168172 RepID=UPI002007DB9E|nr:hypothetical protein Pst134EA_002804 [Puccinia striiformis f. sp. tritici]KAH9464368.1 hypothetical protein Pst134EB_003898 [Puccinia striiformis f. sp. tritici]KAH9472179.1 hypothetical protein Pst134EA_002804 [Puccinia striiformis f. sp. tritici]KAI9618144.1 hypothetical protein H4Q26_012489 [Puccinia striiformis f. sp. tritici PST-130]